VTASERWPWLRSFGNLAVGETVTSVLRMVALLLVARRLGPAAFGTVSVGLVVGGYLVILAHPGLELAGTRRIVGESNPRLLLGRVVGLRLILGALAYPVAVGVTLLLPLDRDLTVIIAIVALLIFTQGFDVRWAFVGVQQTRAVAVASVIGAVVYLGAVLTAVKGPDDVVVVAVIFIAAQAVISTVLVVASGRRFGFWLPDLRPSTPRRALFAESGPLTLAAVARAVTVSVDLILVKALRPAAEAGNYAVASRLMTVGLIYIGLYYTSFFPTLVRALGRDPGDFVALVRTGARRAALIGGAVAAMSVLMIPVVVPVLFGHAYDQAVGLLQILVGALFLVGLSGLVKMSLIALGERRKYSWITAAGLVANLLLDVVLIPTAGAVGAAIATVLTEGVVLVLGYFVIRPVLHARTAQQAELRG
jgi:O-antigen/teichoic acid export membrane protein